MRTIRASLLMAFVVMLLSAQSSIDRPLSTEGTVVVRTHSNYVVIVVAPEGGGKVNRLFVFWPKTDLPAGVKRFEKARVEFEPGLLRVTQADEKNATVYYVNDGGRRPRANALSWTAYSGRGLSHYVGDVPSRFGVSTLAKGDKNLCYIDVVVCEDKIFEID